MTVFESTPKAFFTIIIVIEVLRRRLKPHNNSFVKVASEPINMLLFC